MTESQIEKRLQPIRDDVAAVMAAVQSAAASSTVTAAPGFWQKHTWAIPALAAAIAAVISVILPRMLDQSAKARVADVDSRIEQKLRDQGYGELQNSVKTMQGTLERVGKDVDLLLARNIKQSLVLPPSEFRQQLPQLSGVLAASVQQRVPIETSAIQEVNDRLSPLVKQGDSEAWQATLSLVAYRSVFNSNPTIRFTVKPLPIGGISEYEGPKPPEGESRPIVSASTQAATLDTGALFEFLNKPIQQEAVNAYLILNGGGAVLDGYHIRNAVFVGVHVVYNGGPLKLEDVTFINCRFSIQSGQPGALFVAATIKDERVTFANRG